MTLALVVAVAVELPAPPPPPSKDTLDVTAKTSIGSPAVSPTVPGSAPNQWFYSFCLSSGSSINQRFPIELKLNNTDGTSPETITGTFNIVGGLASITSGPSTWSQTDDGSTTTYSFDMLSSGELADGNYAVNIQIVPSTSFRNDVEIPHDVIHIQVVVGAGCNPGPSCFLTDSSFNFLTDCSGADVTTNSGGTFQVVTNAKNKIVATNPGQFYYNMIWTNDGLGRNVTFTLTAYSNLNNKGANSVHALTFNSSGFTQDESAFDMVNEDGTPCGPTGPCTIFVDAGETLWVTWHAEYAKIGTLASQTNLNSTCSDTCSDDAKILATGTLSDSNGTIGSCTASACAYLKK